MLFCCAVHLPVSFIFLFLLLIISKDAKDLIFLARVSCISQSHRAVLLSEVLIHWHFIALNQTLLDTDIFQLRQIRQYSLIHILDNYL